ncbi:unnamed protein product, partial [Amoebophrya sp. A120]
QNKQQLAAGRRVINAASQKIRMPADHFPHLVSQLEAIATADLPANRKRENLFVREFRLLLLKQLELKNGISFLPVCSNSEHVEQETNEAKDHNPAAE